MNELQKIQRLKHELVCLSRRQDKLSVYENNSPVERRKLEEKYQNIKDELNTLLAEIIKRKEDGVRNQQGDDVGSRPGFFQQQNLTNPQKDAEEDVLKNHY
ncbi:hypothetical protein [Legionella impletisoli]|uniref:Coiled-coil protein n=1 Tax=Legionella impletisoli TaxID=343510 RepID=A0A917NDC3_9GAMM|nr:hypothetical protein [Legionella impletisoli]GGI91090.1 hypothetical protein GCM10007966_19700 [Legionella impletisoli]